MKYNWLESAGTLVEDPDFLVLGAEVEGVPYTRDCPLGTSKDLAYDLLDYALLRVSGSEHKGKVAKLRVRSTWQGADHTLARDTEGTWQAV